MLTNLHPYFEDISSLSKGRDGTYLVTNRKTGKTERATLADLVAMEPHFEQIDRVAQARSYDYGLFAAFARMALRNVNEAGLDWFICTSGSFVVGYDAWTGFETPGRGEGTTAPYIANGVFALYPMTWPSWEANIPGFRQQYELMSALNYTQEELVSTLKSYAKQTTRLALTSLPLPDDMVPTSTISEPLLP